MVESRFKRKKQLRRWTVADLLSIMSKLRGPSGCPWDREQTVKTLKVFVIEEAYETLEAIESGMPEALKDELGDLLLQIVFLSRIAEERGEFDFSDVVHTLAEKLIRRHPHVFPPHGQDSKTIKPRDAQEVIKAWGAVKESEGKYSQRTSLLDGLPIALPALERSRRISQRVSRIGFDWPDIDAVWNKVEEELAELEEASQGASTEAAEQELGDILFTLVNWGRFKGISAEEALRKANRRFSERFHEMELELRRRGKTLEGSTMEEMDRLWNEIKERRKRRE